MRSPRPVLRAPTEVSIFNLKDSCTFPAAIEEKVFLDKATNVNLGTGNVGSQTGLPEVQFTSSTKIDLANGFANIKATEKGGSFKDLTFSIPDYTFGDLLFDVQLDKSKFGGSKFKAFPFTIEGFSGATSLGLFTYVIGALKHSADLSFMLLATGSPLTSVVFSSFADGKNGILQMKHFEVSEVAKIVPNPDPDPIPLPGGIVLLISGLAGLAGLARMRKAAAKA